MKKYLAILVAAVMFFMVCLAPAPADARRGGPGRGEDGERAGRGERRERSERVDRNGERRERIDRSERGERGERRGRGERGERRRNRDTTNENSVGQSQTMGISATGADLGDGNGQSRIDALKARLDWDNLTEDRQKQLTAYWNYWNHLKQEDQDAAAALRATWNDMKAVRDDLRTAIGQLGLTSAQLRSLMGFPQDERLAELNKMIDWSKWDAAAPSVLKAYADDLTAFRAGLTADWNALKANFAAYVQAKALYDAAMTQYNADKAKEDAHNTKVQDALDNRGITNAGSATGTNSDFSSGIRNILHNGVVVGTLTIENNGILTVRLNAGVVADFQITAQAHFGGSNYQYVNVKIYGTGTFNLNIASFFGNSTPNSVQVLDQNKLNFASGTFFTPPSSPSLPTLSVEGLSLAGYQMFSYAGINPFVPGPPIDIPTIPGPEGGTPLSNTNNPRLDESGEHRVVLDLNTINIADSMVPLGQSPEAVEPCDCFPDCGCIPCALGVYDMCKHRTV